MAHKCQWPDGITIKPDGVNELDPCQYKTAEIHKNVDRIIRIFLFSPIIRPLFFFILLLISCLLI